MIAAATMGGTGALAFSSVETACLSSKVPIWLRGWVEESRKKGVELSEGEVQNGRMSGVLFERRHSIAALGLR